MLEGLYSALRRSPALVTLFSMLMGLGVAAMMRPMCAEGCGPLRAPPASSVQGRVFQYGETCVEFVTHPVRCPTEGAAARAIVPTVAEDAVAAAGTGLMRLG